MKTGVTKGRGAVINKRKRRILKPERVTTSTKLQNELLRITEKGEKLHNELFTQLSTLAGGLCRSLLKL